jgi:hypothetical protein
VTAFRAHIGSAVLIGEVREAKSAARSFHEEQAAGHSVSLLSQSAPNLFTSQIGNVVSGETCVIEITYLAPLEMNDRGDALQCILPTTIAPKYQPSRYHSLTNTSKTSIAADTIIAKQLNNITEELTAYDIINESSNSERVGSNSSSSSSSSSSETTNSMNEDGITPIHVLSSDASSSPSSSTSSSSSFSSSVVETESSKLSIEMNIIMPDHITSILCPSHSKSMQYELSSDKQEGKMTKARVWMQRGEGELTKCNNSSVLCFSFSFFLLSFFFLLISNIGNMNIIF